MHSCKRVELESKVGVNSIGWNASLGTRWALEGYIELGPHEWYFVPQSASIPSRHNNVSAFIVFLPTTTCHLIFPQTRSLTLSALVCYCSPILLLFISRLLLLMFLEPICFPLVVYCQYLWYILLPFSRVCSMETPCPKIVPIILNKLGHNCSVFPFPPRCGTDRTLTYHHTLAVASQVSLIYGHNAACLCKDRQPSLISMGPHTHSSWTRSGTHTYICCAVPRYVQSMLIMIMSQQHFTHSRVLVYMPYI